VLSDAQAGQLRACARVLQAPARIVVTGPLPPSVADALRSGASPGVAVLTVAPDALKEVDGPIDVLVVGPTAPYSAAVDVLERWSARVVPGGTMFVVGAFAAPPLTAALLRTIGHSPGWRLFGRNGAVSEYTRADLTRGERVLDGIAHLAQLPSFARAIARRRVRGSRSA
jgi:predicted nicotinamide N-methyase